MNQRRSRTILAGLLVGSVAVLQLTTATSASAATIVAQSQGRFLGGQAAAVDLDNVVALVPAAAEQPDGPASSVHPLNATVLNAVNVDLGSGVQLLGGSGLLSLGTVNQVAVANADGSSSAGSGAVDGTGAISAGAASANPSNATLTLTPVLARGGAVVTTALSAAALTTGALSAHADQAAGAAGAQTGQYNIAALNLSVTSPLVAGIGSTLTSGLGVASAAQTQVNGLTAAIQALGPIGLGGVVTGLPNLGAVLTATIGTGDISVAGGAIHANLLTGVITVDLAALLTSQSLDLNNLPPDTDLLAIVTTALTTDLLPAITAELTNLTSALTTAFNGITVSLLGSPILPTLFSAVVAPVIAPVLALALGVVPVGTTVATAVVTPLISGLSALLSLQVNGQATAAGTFTESALTVGVVPATPLASLRLASASVGPNAGPQLPAITGLNPNTGPTTGGQGVTVTGSSFVVGGTSITIGGITIPAAQVTVTSTTSLTFATPAHAVGPVDVTATTTVGTSAPQTYTYVTVAPGAIAPPVITAPGNGSTTTDPHVPISGTGVAADTVTVFEGAAVVCTATVGSGGTWTCPPAAVFSLGGHTIHATQTDATSTSPDSTAVTFTVVAAALIGAPVITSPQDGSTVIDPKPPISGTGVAGDTVTVSAGTTTICSALVAGNGIWTCTPSTALALGQHTIVAVQTDGSTYSANSNSVTFTVAEAPAELPNTGASTGTGLLIGLVLLGLGGFTLLGARRLGRSREPRAVRAVDDAVAGLAGERARPEPTRSPVRLRLHRTLGRVADRWGAIHARRDAWRWIWARPRVTLAKR